MGLKKKKKKKSRCLPSPSPGQWRGGRESRRPPEEASRSLGAVSGLLESGLSPPPSSNKAQLLQCPQGPQAER